MSNDNLKTIFAALLFMSGLLMVVTHLPEMLWMMFTSGSDPFAITPEWLSGIGPFFMVVGVVLLGVKQSDFTRQRRTQNQA